MKRGALGGLPWIRRGSLVATALLVLIGIATGYGSIHGGSLPSALAQAPTPTGGFAGIVTDANGLPLGGAVIVALNSTGTTVGTASTANDGSYSIGGLTDGAYTLGAFLVSYQDAA